MATNEYIVIADIDQHNFKQLPDETKQRYVDDLNDWYEAYAGSKNFYYLWKNLKVDSIEYPITILVKEFLISKLLMSYASDNINGASTNLNAAGTYQNIYVMSRDEYNQMAPRINAGAIAGYINEATSTVVFGKRVR